jgi:hypothetical protein
MRADLDRAVPGIGDFEKELRRTDIEFDVAGLGDDFAWDHDATGLAGEQ